VELAAALPNVPILETRELWWNINDPLSKTFFYFLAILSLLIFSYGFIKKLLWIFKGRNNKFEDRFTDFKSRIFTLLSFGLAQKKILRKRTPGIAHLMTFFGFFILWVVTNIVAVQEKNLFGFYFFQGSFYKLISWVADMGGILLLLGVIIFSLRRYLFTSKSLDNTQLDWIQPTILAIFVITGFFLEAFRMAATKSIESYAPVGAALAQLFAFMTTEDLIERHKVLWWVHGLLTFIFIAMIPYSKFSHIFMAPLTIFFRSKRHRGQLPTPFKLQEILEAEAEGQEIDEADFSSGVQEYKDFSWKTLLDSEACTACGRCHVVCPAVNTDKVLSPKFLMLDIKKLASNEKRDEVYEFISQDVLWSCTTCNACVEECPILIEHVDSIVDMRRGLLAKNKAPANLQSTLKNIRTKSNPWGLSPLEREKWISEFQSETGLRIKLARESKNKFEYLYWVGSPGAYDSRNISVTKANAKLFTKAGLDFAVLGNEEKSSGDLARRAGDEGLFQELAMENIETLMKYGVRKIITQCPHAYNTLKNEYPEFGLEGVEVYHHTEILAELIKDSKLKSSKTLSETVTYHDPCYLGRYNQVFDAPRFILESIPGISIKSIDNEKSKSTCCGGGGGQMYYEIPGTQINNMRFEELNEQSPNLISVACPYCSLMLDSATKTAFPGTYIPNIEDVAITLARSI
jgi:Fe-S oxidoreductase/nitrate reductase gamma subunit